MAWELPSSITRTLDRFALSRVQRLEGDDNIVPTVELLSLDRPPFRHVGHRFFATGAVASDVTGAAIALSTSSNRCVVVVDQIVCSISGVAAEKVTITVGSGFLAGNAFVYAPENSLSRPLPNSDARLTERLGTAGGANLYTFVILANSPVIIDTELLLLVPPPSAISGDAYCAANVTPAGVTLYVSFAGRIWYSEE